MVQLLVEEVNYLSLITQCGSSYNDSMKLAERFARRLKLIRKYRGLTQEDASEKIGLTQSALSAMETGKRGFTFKSLERICDVYKVHPSDLFLDNDFPPLVLSREAVKELLRMVADLKDHEVGQLIARAEMMHEEKEK